MKQIERLVIRKRKALTNKSRLIFQQAIKQQYEAAIKAVEMYGISQIEQHISAAVRSEPIEEAFSRSYSMAAEIAMTWRNYHLPPKKDGTDDIYRAVFERELSTYGIVKAGKRITNITGTTQDRIEEVVRGAVSEAFNEGLGIEATKDLILNVIRQDYKEFTPWRARLISQTEMITASNQAAFEGTRSTGFEFKKYWSTSGLANVRDSHRLAEQDSIDHGGYFENEKFSNGLLFPGDPVGSADEVCQCHCTLLTEVI